MRTGRTTRRSSSTASPRYVRISTAGGHHVGTYGDSAMGVVIGQLQVYSQGGAAVVSPQVLNFGSIAAGTTRQLTFDIENQSGSPLNISFIVPLGLGNPFVVADPTGAITVAAGQARTVQVVFTPTEVGTYEAMRIGVIGDLGVKYIMCNGSSYVAGTPDLKLSASALNFGTGYLPVGGGAIAEPLVLPVTVSNLGDVALAVSSIVTETTAGPGDAAYSTAPDAAFEVAANPDPSQAGVATVNVTFAPVAEGTYNGQIVLESNDPDESPATITLTGRAVVTQPASVSTQDWMLY